MSEDIPHPPDHLRPGARLAGYLLEEEIGRGGMAVVYRAYDDRLDRRVALKVLAPELARDDAFRTRFIQESRAAASVDHPHIIPVFDAGEAGGVLYLAMRYVPGGDVKRLLDHASPLPVARACALIAQVASALDAAHARGLVHRDVKPTNMLLDMPAAGGRPDHVYLSDFGLAKPAAATTGVTLTGQFLGTADYCAPEQIQGNPVDSRADQYSLACASFEMLCGAPPFHREQAMAVLSAHVSEAPPALAARRRELPAAVDAVMARALAKAPQDRYPRCLDFAEALLAACGLGPGGTAAAFAAPAAPGRPYPPTAPAAVPGRAGSPGAPVGGPQAWAGPGLPPPRQPQPRPPAGPEPGAGPPGRQTAVFPPAPVLSPAGRDPHRGEQDVGHYVPGAQIPGQYGPRGYGPGPPGPGAYGPGLPGAGPVAPGGPPRPRRRHGRAALLIGVAAVLAAAVVGVVLLRHPAQPQARAGGQAGATASGTPHAASSAPAVPARPAGPAATVRAYFRAINRQEYARAWALGGRNTGSGYPAFVRGFQGTAHDAITILSVTANVVTAQVRARQTDGSVKVYQGTYAVRHGVITRFRVSRIS